MNPKIKEQKELMEMALQKLGNIRTIERLVTPVDPVISKVLIEEEQLAYADIMSDLMNNFLNLQYNELQQPAIPA